MKRSLINSIYIGFIVVVLFAPFSSVYASCETDYAKCSKAAGKEKTAEQQKEKMDVCNDDLNACKDKTKSTSSDGSSSNPSVGNYGLDASAGSAGLNTSGTIAGITGKIIGVVLSLVGIAFFILMLYGGFLWMTARGEEAQAKKAKGIIIDAVIGLIIVAAAGIITSFVFSNVVPK